MVWSSSYGVAASLLAKPPHSCWTIALLGAKDWPWFSYNIKVVKRLCQSHSSWENKPWISSFVFSPWQGSSCMYFLCSMNVRQSSLSFQRTSPYIVHTTKTFNLCVLQPPSTGNICCALIFSISSLKKYYFFLSSFLICRVRVLDTDRINVETKDHHYIY